MKLSVIIPVYNVAPLLDRCVQSIVEQDHHDLQIILVDDGSTDGSGEKCDQWAAKDRRVIATHKANGGLSDARNHGIEMATGNLITFVDSDDFIAPHTYKEVVGAMDPETDIIEYPIWRFYGSPRQQLLTFRPHHYEDEREYWLKGKGYEHTYACNKIFRRDVFRHTRFPKGKVFEDVLTMPAILSEQANGHPCRISTTDRGLYYYCANPNSITAQASGEQLHTLLSGHIGHKYLLDDDRYYLHVLNIQLDVYSQTSRPVELPSKRITHFNGLTGKQMTKALLTNILGIKRLCRLYKTFHNIGRRHW